MENNIATMYSNGSKKIDDMLKETKGRIVGDNLVDITSKLLELSVKYNLFQRDIVTGLCKSCLSDDPSGNISPKLAKILWLTHFKDRIRMRTMSPDGETYKLKSLTTQDLDILWENIYTFSTYNSRKEMFDNIPAWDGTPRIESFMRDYFHCDANPNFFLLFLTAIIGKMDDPEKNYCPFFFTFAGQEKGTGKSSLCEHLLGKYAVMSYPTSRKEDFFVNAYDANAIAYIDDENKLTDRKNNSNAWGLDELKAFVTQKYDRFSRKFMQPEEHARGFVFVRTTNEATTVFSPNERRQIIFNVRLPEHTCLHWDLSQDYMNQLLAEAKDYYVKHNGIYQMTNEDWGDIEQQNRENFNYETDDFEALYTFVTQLYESPESNDKYLVRICDDNGLWASWRGYNKWRKDNKEVSIDPRRFNRLMELLAKLHPQMLSYSSTMQRLDGSATYIHAGKIRPKSANLEPNIDDIPDMEF
jgi:hypothetical protein